MTYAYHRAARPRLLAVLCATALGATGPRARAQDDTALLAEPTRYTDVIDAFDAEDPFDFDLSLEFRRAVTKSTVQREHARVEDGELRTGFVDVAESQRETNGLVVGAAVGLYRDVMLFGRLPLVLNDARDLRASDGADCSEDATDGCVALEAQVAGQAPDDPDRRLFQLDPTVSSARRSGIPSFDLGIAWAPLNQYRSSHVPTWMLRAETSIGTGDVMKPCVKGGGCGGGVSRGTLGLELASRWSYRHRHVEPYAGVSYAWEWATAADGRFSPVPDLPQHDPPRVAETTLGAAWIPWEDRGRFQRFAVDGRARAAWVSRGQDYTPLFDALGASSHPSLTAPNYDRLEATPERREVAFRGLTRVDAYARFAFETAVTMRAARYVGFRLGAAVRHALPHLITGAGACNPDVDPGGDSARAGSCTDGVINPVHRPTIDLPGRRFRLDGETTVELSAAATAMF